MTKNENGAGVAAPNAAYCLSNEMHIRKIFCRSQAGIESGNEEVDRLFNICADRLKLSATARLDIPEYSAISTYQNGLDSTAAGLRSHTFKLASTLDVSLQLPINDHGEWLMTKSGLRGRVFYGVWPDPMRKSPHRLEGYWLFGSQGLWMKVPASMLRRIMRRSGKLNGRERIRRNGLQDVEEALLHICQHVVVYLSSDVVDALRSLRPTVRDVAGLQRIAESVGPP